MCQALSSERNRLQTLEGHTLLYGGSFNPPHVGHQMACLYGLETLGAAELWTIPTLAHPFGKPLLDFKHRQAMLELMLAPFAERAKISLVEKECGSSRTFDVVSYLQQEHENRSFAWIVGADILAEKESWYRWQDLEKMLPIVVLGRSGYPQEGDLMPNLPEVSSSEIRRLCAENKSINSLVPDSVAAYIRSNDLYKEQE